MKRTLTLVAICTSAVLCLSGCSKKQPPPEPAGTIAVAHSSLFGASVASAALQNGFEVIATTEDTDLNSRTISAIVLHADEEKTIRRANAAGIPVFTVAVDNRAGGRLAADAMHEALGGKGKVAILDHPDDEAAILRTQGFQARLIELDSDIQVVGQLPGGGNRAQSVGSTQVLLHAQGALRGIFAVNDDSALGARDALEAAGKKDQIIIVGFGGRPEDGVLASPLPLTDGIGEKMVNAIQRFLDGETVDQEILIPMTLLRNRPVP